MGSLIGLGKVITNINIQSILTENVENKSMWLFAANEYYRKMQPYIPYRNGDLSRNVTITANKDTGYIQHDMYYSGYVYKGDFNFRKDVHPLASRQWDKTAEPAIKPDVINSIEAYMKEH